MGLTDTLLQRIEAYCAAARMSERAFGIAVARNHKLVPRLRAGYSVISRTHDRIEAYIAANPPPRARRPSPAASPAAAVPPAEAAE